MKDLITSLRVGNIFCLIHVGDMPQEKCDRSSKLFAEEVMPKLRHLWPEYADDDRFWIHPIQQARRAGLPGATAGSDEHGQPHRRDPGPGGVTFSVRVHEGGSGPDVLFLHGAGGLLQDDPFLAALSRHYRVHAPTAARLWRLRGGRAPA